eukprot:SAG11_NODE_8832_length_972_cov_0.973654_2_plen_70_part_00
MSINTRGDAAAIVAAKEAVEACRAEQAEPLKKIIDAHHKAQDKCNGDRKELEKLKSAFWHVGDKTWCAL